MYLKLAWLYILNISFIVFNLQSFFYAVKTMKTLNILCKCNVQISTVRNIKANEQFKQTKYKLKYKDKALQIKQRVKCDALHISAHIV